MIIGLVGFIGSGKGTVGDILVREHGYKRFAFADALKDAVAQIFLWPRGLLEGDTVASREFREKVDPYWTEEFGYEVTPRLILQRMGTEACRHGISDNIWISALKKRIHGYEDVVLSDVRFPNEIEFVQSVGGKIFWVSRGPSPTDEELSKMHVSETAWRGCEVSAIINNDGTIEDLREKVNRVLTSLTESDKMFHHSV